MITKLVNILYNFYKKITEEKVPELYEIDGFTVRLGKNHVLPVYQKRFPMYDRFVPFLASCAKSSEDVIIDVGANVGDTTLAMIKHTQGQIICVEPANMFYKLCIENIKNAGEPYNSRIRVVQAFIAQDSDANYDVSLGKGTAVRRNVEESRIPTYTIMQLVEKLGVELDRLAVIKTDTDGYDSECIMSLGEDLKDISPVFFFENQIDNIEEYEQYIHAKEYLQKYGYTSFFVFDAYGNYLCENNSDGSIEIDSYLYRISKGIGTRSFPYVDILAAKEDKRELCKKAIENYLNSVEKMGGK